MACPSCAFARSFIRRTASPYTVTSRTITTSSAASAEASQNTKAVATQPKETPLLNISKTKISHKAHNPNARPLPPSHHDITRRLGIRYARPVPGDQEWRASTYTYNKALSKTYPTAGEVTDKLLNAYATFRKLEGGRSTKNAVAQRRRSPAGQTYIARAGTKDFGDKIRIDAFMYQEPEAGAGGRAPRKGR